MALEKKIKFSKRKKEKIFLSCWKILENFLPEKSVKNKELRGSWHRKLARILSAYGINTAEIIYTFFFLNL